MIMNLSPVAASAAEASFTETAFFSVHARAEPGVMPRVLELFAKRGLVPSSWRSAVGGADQAWLTIDIEMSGLDREITAYIAACLRQITAVDTVLTPIRNAVGEQSV
jgi:acetolactate synthase small subunit